MYCVPEVIALSHVVSALVKRNANCEGGDTELLNNLHSFLKESHASPPNPSTSHGKETFHDGLSGFHCRASAAGGE